MAGSVGEVRFHVGLTGKNQFQSETQKLASSTENKITPAFSKLGKTVAAAFSVAAVIKFGKACVDAESETIQTETKLATVMKQRMHASDSAVDSLKELAETQKENGVIDDDVIMAGQQQLATFLNTTGALKKLTPALANLLAQQDGANATAESAVNIGNLMGKVMQGQTSALTRVGITFTAAQEKVLKYGNEEQRAAMLSEVITDNVGQMNSALGNTPVGKITQMKLLFDDMMKNIGAILLNVIGPVISAINTLLRKIVSATQQVRKLSDQIFGSSKKSAAAVGSVAESTDALTDATEGASDAAEKTAFAFDGLNKLDGSSASSGAGAQSVPSVSADEGEKSAENIETPMSRALDSLKEKAREAGDAFENGFSDSAPRLKEDSEKIKKSIQGIKDSIVNIFTDPSVVSSAENLTQQTSRTLGQIVGAAAQIGADAATGYSEGLNRALNSHREDIKKTLKEMFDINADTLKNIGDAASAVANIFSPLSGESAAKTWENLDGIFISLSESAGMVGSAIGNMASQITLGPLIDNSDKLKQVVKDLLDQAAAATQPIADFAKNMQSSISDTIETYILPSVSRLRDGISSAVGIIADGYDQKIKPIIDDFLSRWKDIWDNHLSPDFQKFEKSAGKIFESISVLFDTLIKPIAEYFVNYIWPLCASTVTAIGKVVLDLVGVLADAIANIMQIVAGAFEIVEGIVTGNGAKIKQGFADIGNGIVSILKGIVEGIVNIFNDIFGWIETVIVDKVKEIVGVFTNIKKFFTGGGKGGVDAKVGTEVQKPKINYPAYATGSVIQPNNPHLAIVGDNTKEQEIVSPYSTIVRAVRDANAGSSAGGTQRIEIPVYLDSRVLTKATADVSDRDRRLRG